MWVSRSESEGGEPRPTHTHTLPAHGRKNYTDRLLICNNPAMQPVLYICTSICSLMSLSKMCEFESGTGVWSAYEYKIVLHVLRKIKILARAGLFFHTGWNMLGFLLNCYVVLFFPFKECKDHRVHTVYWLVEMKKGECIWHLSWSEHWMYVMLTIVKGGERAPPRSPAWANSLWNVGQRAAIATLCVLCGQDTI